LTSRTEYDFETALFLVLGILFATVGIAVGFGRIGDALVMNNPDAGNFFNPGTVSLTLTYAGLIIGFSLSVGAALIGLAIHRWK
jgi:hypothetical protein